MSSSNNALDRQSVIDWLVQSFSLMNSSTYFNNLMNQPELQTIINDNININDTYGSMCRFVQCMLDRDYKRAAAIMSYSINMTDLHVYDNIDKNDGKGDEMTDDLYDGLDLDFGLHNYALSDENMSVYMTSAISSVFKQLKIFISQYEDTEINSLYMGTGFMLGDRPPRIFRPLTDIGNSILSLKITDKYCVRIVVHYDMIDHHTIHEHGSLSRLCNLTISCIKHKIDKVIKCRYLIVKPADDKIMRLMCDDDIILSNEQKWGKSKFVQVDLYLARLVDSDMLCEVMMDDDVPEDSQIITLYFEHMEKHLFISTLRQNDPKLLLNEMIRVLSQSLEIEKNDTILDSIKSLELVYQPGCRTRKLSNLLKPKLDPTLYKFKPPNHIHQLSKTSMDDFLSNHTDLAIISTDISTLRPTILHIDNLQHARYPLRCTSTVIRALDKHMRICSPPLHYRLFARRLLCDGVSWYQAVGCESIVEDITRMPVSMRHANDKYDVIELFYELSEFAEINND